MKVILDLDVDHPDRPVLIDTDVLYFLLTKYQHHDIITQVVDLAVQDKILDIDGNLV